MNLTTEQRIKRAHVTMMKHPETALYSGVFMLGETSVVDDTPTAYTDGLNKRYGRKFIDGLTDAELNGVVLHENLHIVFRHLLHSRDLFEEDQRTANMAADFVVNDVIMSLTDKALCDLPAGGLYDPSLHNMNMREIYYMIRNKCTNPNDPSDKGDPRNDKSEGGSSSNSVPGTPRKPTRSLGDAIADKDYKFDEHDSEAFAPKNAEDEKSMDTTIDRAIREGALLAGRLGASIPRVIADLLEPKIDWRKELREFVSSTMRGNDEFTWRKFNRRLLANDIYMPSVESEAIGELVVAIDTSGSIGNAEIAEFASELVSICDSVSPEAIRVLWWDTKVHGEQVFRDNYENIASMLKPMGGGGTRVGCVAEHINKHKITAQAVLVFTDGFVENAPTWDISSPSLWLVTKNRSWTPPSGHVVFVER